LQNDAEGVTLVELILAKLHVFCSLIHEGERGGWLDAKRFLQAMAKILLVLCDSKVDRLLEEISCGELLKTLVLLDHRLADIVIKLFADFLHDVVSLCECGVQSLTREVGRLYCCKNDTFNAIDDSIV